MARMVDYVGSTSKRGSLPCRRCSPNTDFPTNPPANSRGADDEEIDDDRQTLSAHRGLRIGRDLP
jgi:hypothetical protein